MKLTLELQQSQFTGEPMFTICKDGGTVGVKFDEKEANEAFEKFVTAQRNLKENAEKQILKSVEI